MAAKMKCDCGAEMNHHADKLVLPTDAEEAASGDPAFGGVIEEHHWCPQCGKGAVVGGR